ncbi:MAG: hypothetical protein WCG23_06795 [bacterium]
MIQAQKNRIEEFLLNSSIKGIHGTLINCCSIPPEYSQVFHLAFGPKSKYIVVDNTDAAADAIKLIKENKLGRAVFIVLDMLDPHPALDKVEFAGFIDYFINLAKCDEIFKPALYNALENTILVEELELAKNQFTKFRMVTLDGCILERDGRITGGYIPN